MTPDTIFRISSMTKPVTAVAATILASPSPPADDWIADLGTQRAHPLRARTRRSILEAVGRFGWDGGLGSNW